MNTVVDVAAGAVIAAPVSLHISCNMTADIVLLKHIPIPIMETLNFTSLYPYALGLMLKGASSAAQNWLSNSL